MKNALKNLVAAALLMTSVSAMAGGNDVGNANSDLISRLKAANGRTGKIVESYDKENTGKCTIKVEDYVYESGEKSVIVSFEGTGMYFEPNLGIGSDADYIDANTVIAEKNSNRPGGDACGDFGGAMNYKKGLAFKGKQIAIRETFRCVLDGFKKYDLYTICELK